MYRSCQLFAHNPRSISAAGSQLGWFYRKTRSRTQGHYSLVTFVISPLCVPPLFAQLPSVQTRSVRSIRTRRWSVAFLRRAIIVYSADTRETDARKRERRSVCAAFDVAPTLTCIGKKKKRKKEREGKEKDEFCKGLCFASKKQLELGIVQLPIIVFLLLRLWKVCTQRERGVFLFEFNKFY